MSLVQFCYSSLCWGQSDLWWLLFDLLWAHENLLAGSKGDAQWWRDYTGADDGSSVCSRRLFCSWIKVHAVVLVCLSKALSSPCGKLFCLHYFTLSCSALSLSHFSSLFPLPFKRHLSVFPIQALSLLSALCKSSMPSLPFINSCSFTSLLSFLHSSGLPLTQSGLPSPPAPSTLPVLLLCLCTPFSVAIQSSAVCSVPCEDALLEVSPSWWAN